LTFLRDDVVMVVLQQRSGAVVTYVDSYSVAPVFACEPEKGGRPLQGDWLWRNFVREYLEELHDVEELQDPGGRHVLSDWFLEHPESQRLSSWRESGELSFDVLGVSVDALNGEVNLACNVHISSPNFVTDVLPSLLHNWESSGYIIEPLSSVELDAEILADRFQPGALVSLELTRRSRLAERGAQ